ncbi:MAG: hypothetical protein ABSD56_02860 [Bryobacteraceae bacterium]
MPATQAVTKADPSLRVCSYDDRPEAMDGFILMGESLCRANVDVSLHLTAPEAPDSVRAWAQGRPEVVLSTTRIEGVTGWDAKPWLLLQELSERQEVLWLDSDVIVNRALSSLLRQFPPDSLIVAEEWLRAQAIPASHFWGMPSGRTIPLINPCFVRATQAHRPLLERWLQMTRDPRYREAQALPLERRPLHLLGDNWLLIALLESEEFCQVPFHCIRRARHIAQCAGSSGYRPRDRLLDLFRGLPPLIHGLGRKPWESTRERSRIRRFLLDLATDVSPYVLAARRVARDIDMTPDWLEARTRLGAMLRTLTGGHPGMAGLPLASIHALHIKINQMMGSRERAR